MKWLGIEESKTNPNATGRSTLIAAGKGALTGGVFMLGYLFWVGKLADGWWWVIVFTLGTAFVAALFEWQSGDLDDEEEEEVAPKD